MDAGSKMASSSVRSISFNQSFLSHFTEHQQPEPILHRNLATRFHTRTKPRTRKDTKPLQAAHRPPTTNTAMVELSLTIRPRRTTNRLKRQLVTLHQLNPMNRMQLQQSRPLVIRNRSHNRQKHSTPAM